MDKNGLRWYRRAIDTLPFWIIFLLGLWLVILRPLGAQLELVPGDLGDARFNNYVLEHFYRWISGLTKDYWNAPFFYPFPQAISFSDNLLGSAPFYALFRSIGIDRIAAFQGWYILGCVLNFSAAGYVLWKSGFKPLAIGMGAFFFAFGLPLLAQENHAQLVYRFCIPLACYSLWQFYRVPQLRKLAFLMGWLVWQFYLTIYMGIFLILLIIVLVVLLPWFAPAETLKMRLLVWWRCLRDSWQHAKRAERIMTSITIIILGIGLLIQAGSYYRVVEGYGFTRHWAEVSSMLPRLESYLLADNSKIWKATAGLFSTLPMRWEHQLFPGLVVMLIVLAGIVYRFHNDNEKLAWLHISAGLVLVVLTLEVNGFSIYWLIWHLPGMNSLRAITRVMLVVMWPLSLFMAWSIDGLIHQWSQKRRYLVVPVYLLAGLLVAESVFYSHYTFSKADAQKRLETLHQEIPETIPSDPVLFVAMKPEEPFWATEIDAMLLSQQLGWPTINGYSGNFPQGYSIGDSCNRISKWLKSYIYYAGITSPSFYERFTKRVVPIGLEGCSVVE